MAWRLRDLKREPCKIHKTKDILEHCEMNIQSGKPFSLVRFGDASLGILASRLCSGNVDFGRKWGGVSGLRAANAIMNQITIPEKDRELICKRVVQAANNSDYIDSYDGDLLAKFRVGFLAFRWKEIHEDIGIYNESYCTTMFHNFINVSGEYNILNLMKGRRIFCVNNIIPKVQLKLVDKCKHLDFYKIPGRGKRGGHYKNHYKKLCRLLKKKARKYDLFLIGAGLLAPIYCDVVKNSGGRAMDVGTLFYLWNGMKVKSRASRYLVNDGKGILCQRILKPHNDIEGIW